MMGHPLAIWTFPEVERRRRLVAFAAGAALGASISAVAFLLGLAA